MLLRDAVAEILSQKGVDLLKDVQCFKAMLRDLAPECEKERKVFENALDDKFLSYFFCEDQSKISINLFKAQAELSDRGISSTWTYLILSYIAEPLGWKEELDVLVTPQTETNETVGITDIEVPMLSATIETVVSEENLRQKRLELEPFRRLISLGASDAVAVTETGNVLVAGRPAYYVSGVQNWKNVLMVESNFDNISALTYDGNILFSGVRHPVERDARKPDWKNIIGFSAGPGATVGICSDHTVCALTASKLKNIDLSGWNNIIEVSSGPVNIFGLKADGRVLAVGDNSYGQCDIEHWRDVVSISAGGGCVLGLKKDGTVLASGRNDAGQCNVSHWRNVVQVQTKAHYSVGLLYDGTCVSTAIIGDPSKPLSCGGGQNDLSGWRDILAVACSGHVTVGLRKDGYVEIASNKNVDFTTPTYNNLCDSVSKWKLFDSVDSFMYHRQNLITFSVEKNDCSVIPENDENVVELQNKSRSEHESHIKQLKTQIDQLKSEKASLGLFSLKQKTQIDAKIRELIHEINILTI